MEKEFLSRKEKGLLKKRFVPPHLWKHYEDCGVFSNGRYDSPTRLAIDQSKVLPLMEEEIVSVQEVMEKLAARNNTETHYVKPDDWMYYRFKTGEQAGKLMTAVPVEYWNWFKKNTPAGQW